MRHRVGSQSPRPGQFSYRSRRSLRQWRRYLRPARGWRAVRVRGHLDVRPALRHEPRRVCVTWTGTVTTGGEATLSARIELDPEYVERNYGDFGSHTVTQHGFDIAALNTIVACSFNAQTCPSDPAAEFVDLTCRDDAQRLQCADRELGLRGPIERGHVARTRERVVRREGRWWRDLSGGRDRGREGRGGGGGAGRVRALCAGRSRRSELVQVAAAVSAGGGDDGVAGYRDAARGDAVDRRWCSRTRPGTGRRWPRRRCGPSCIAGRPTAATVRWSSGPGATPSRPRSSSASDAQGNADA